MTEKDKHLITELRTNDIGYAKIADTLSLSIATVKSYCIRNNIKSKENQLSCLECGKSIIPLQGRREKKFCSDKCRIKWWNHHTNFMRSNATCVHCGKEFHGRAGRKFCSHACYIAERFKHD